MDLPNPANALVGTDFDQDRIRVARRFMRRPHRLAQANGHWVRLDLDNFHCASNPFVVCRRRRSLQHYRPEATIMAQNKKNPLARENGGTL
jgi:hypothetical protein